MTAITDYSSLQAAIKTYFAGRDDWSVTDFIALGEARLFRILRVREMEKETTLVASASVTLPTDFIQPISVFLNNDPVTEIAPSSYRNIYRKNPSTATGKPTSYAMVGTTTMRLRPVPDAADDITLFYYARPSALSVASANAVLIAHPDAYLYAALIETAPFTGDDERLIMWSKLLTSTVGEANKASFHFGNSSPRMSI